MKELAREVETIRSYMQELKQLHSQDPIIDFDDNEQIDNSILPEGLEVIKEVSEHDLSITMSLQSLQSFKSDTLEDYPNPSMHHPISITPADPDSENRPGAGNCLVGDYQDALEILKNYNSGNGAVMSKRVGPEATHTEGRIKVGNIFVDRDIQEPPAPEPRKGRNDTMSKLKKMRKIEDLDI